MYNSGDIFLFALSAKRKVPWSIVKRWFEEVHRRGVLDGQSKFDEPVASARWQALRTLSCLGHIDMKFDSDEIKVVVAPPVLAALPGRGVARAVLCGARSPASVENLQQAATIGGFETIVGPHLASCPYVPTRIELCADSSIQIHNVAASVNLRFIDFPPARSLARVSASLQEYCRGLVWSNEAEMNWRRQDFDTERLQFLPNSRIDSKLRLSRYQNPVTSIWYYRLWRNRESAEVELDWGRYAVLALSSHRVLQYDMAIKRASVPYGAPLPTLFSRAFGLCRGHCSTVLGLVPSNEAQRSYVYNDVPPSVFNEVASKLNQQPIEAKGKRWIS